MFFFALNYNMNTNKLNCPWHYWGTLGSEQLKTKKYWINNNDDLFTYIARVTCADAHTRISLVSSK